MPRDVQLHPAPPGRPAAPSAPERALGNAKRQEGAEPRARLLRRLAEEVAALRAAIGDVAAQTRRLAALEGSRRLTTAEAEQARALTRESERLRWELRRAFLEFDLLRRPGPLRPRSALGRGGSEPPADAR